MMGISVLWGLVPLLLATILYDLRYLRLPNAISLLMLLLFVLWAPFALAPSQILWRAVVAGVVLGIGLGAFAARLIGGGDVKVLAALMLFLPLRGLPHYFLAFGLCLLAGTAMVLALRRTPLAKASRWQVLTATGRFPVGLAIGGAGLIFLMWHGPGVLRL